MATFAKATFDAASYLKHRPTYTRDFIAHILRYADIKSNAVALDLGCGPGQATALLATSEKVKKVYGFDPSEGMIKSAREAWNTDPAALVGGPVEKSTSAEVEYKVGYAEDLQGIEDESLDIVTAGQAAHWFKHDKAYREILRVLKPGGTAAYWGYGYLYMPDVPEVSAKISELGLSILADYWEDGREGPDSLYDTIPFPKGDGWDTTSFRRQKFDLTDSASYKRAPDLPGPPETEHFPMAMSKQLDFEGIKAYLKTWSSSHNYMKKHQPAQHIIDEHMDSVKSYLPQTSTFKVEWPTGLLLMKKAQ